MTDDVYSGEPVLENENVWLVYPLGRNCTSSAICLAEKRLTSRRQPGDGGRGGRRKGGGGGRGGGKEGGQCARLLVY